MGHLQRWPDPPDLRQVGPTNLCPTCWASGRSGKGLWRSSGSGKVPKSTIVPSRPAVVFSSPTIVSSRLAIVSSRHTIASSMLTIVSSRLTIVSSRLTIASSSHNRVFKAHNRVVKAHNRVFKAGISQKSIISAMNKVPVARLGPISSQDGATLTRKPLNTSRPRFRLPGAQKHKKT